MRIIILLSIRDAYKYNGNDNILSPFVVYGRILRTKCGCLHTARKLKYITAVLRTPVFLEANVGNSHNIFTFYYLSTVQ